MQVNKRAEQVKGGLLLAAIVGVIFKGLVTLVGAPPFLLARLLDIGIAIAPGTLIACLAWLVRSLRRRGPVSGFRRVNRLLLLIAIVSLGYLVPIYAIAGWQPIMIAIGASFLTSMICVAFVGHGSVLVAELLLRRRGAART